MVWMFGHAAMASADPSVLVKTEVVKEMPLSSTLKAYGVISTDPRHAKGISFARAGEISSLMVAVGQTVRRGTPLLAFHTDPAESAAYDQAVTAVNYAQKALQRTEMLVQQHLATQAQLATSGKALADAITGRDVLRRQGKGTGTEQVTAPFDGIVTGLNVSAGDHVAAGATLLQLAPRASLMADLGVEPEDIYQVKAGMTVRVLSIFDRSRMVEGRVVSIHGVINPQTRLVDVLVRLADHPADHFIPGMYILGEIVLDKHLCRVVPRSAVLRDDKGAYIYQVEQNRAVRINVTTGEENDQVVAIQGDIHPDLKIVVQGNYELQDNMAVREDVK
jgi:RND family efflux transporter MFP subunit